MRLAVLSLLCLSGLAAARFQGAFSSALSAVVPRQAQAAPLPTNCPDALNQTVACLVNGLGGACCPYGGAIVAYCGNDTVNGYIAGVLTGIAEGVVPVNLFGGLLDLLNECPAGNTAENCHYSISSACDCLDSVTDGSYGGCAPLVDAQLGACVGSGVSSYYLDYIAFQAAAANITAYGEATCLASVAAVSTCVLGNPPNGSDYSGTAATCCELFSFTDLLCTGVNLSVDALLSLGLSQQVIDYVFNIAPVCEVGLSELASQYSYLGPYNFCPVAPGGSGSNGGGGGGGGGSNNGQCDYSAVAPGVYWYNGMYVTANPEISTGEYAYTLYDQAYYYLPGTSTYQLSPAFQCVSA